VGNSPPDIARTLHGWKCLGVGASRYSCSLLPAGPSTHQREGSPASATPALRVSSAGQHLPAPAPEAAATTPADQQSARTPALSTVTRRQHPASCWALQQEARRRPGKGPARTLPAIRPQHSPQAPSSPSRKRAGGHGGKRWARIRDTPPDHATQNWKISPAASEQCAIAGFGRGVVLGGGACRSAGSVSLGLLLPPERDQRARKVGQVWRGLLCTCVV
jgi:hypothetical protein